MLPLYNTLTHQDYHNMLTLYNTLTHQDYH